MSDQSQGPGWWQASDLKWYPPDQVPGTGAGPTTPDPTEPAGGWGAAPPSASPPPAWGDPPPPAPAPPAWGTPPPPTWAAPPAYGVPGWSPYGARGGPALPSVNGLGVAALVLGILGLLTFLCFFITLPLSMAGVACGGSALNRIKNGVADPADRGLALAGTIVSGIALAAGSFVLLAVLAS